MNYERPSDKWICGHACEGQPCRIGPSRWGQCRATFECNPVKDGNRWKCTRPKSDGGPCAEGPLPDGTCCRAIPRCQPVRSLRSKRGLVTWATVAVTIGGLLLLLCSGARGRFLLPGALSAPHAGSNFNKAAQIAGVQGDCAACHLAAGQGISQWLRTAERAGLWKFPRETTGPQRIDATCQKCHTRHNFHAANMPRESSCSACHLEHQGPGPMTSPPPEHCITCHGDPAVMKTTVIHEFSSDHPEFWFRRNGQKDANTLKFNHQRHFADDIPAVNGQKLTCATCHKPDVSGIRHEPVTFAAHCRACHSLQFDVRNPTLQLPHGEPVAVRAFLNSLPTQYADLASRTGRADVEEFVTAQLTALKADVITGRDFESDVFFTADRRAPGAKTPYPGCAKCHEVKTGTPPIVTAPAAAQRWLWRGEFNHTTHRSVSCETCHTAKQSKLTADLILPGKDTCASCHGAKAGVSGACITCHDYHREARR